jgi:hypothetical protein
MFTRNRGSKHLRARTGGGRFRRATLGDFGMACCTGEGGCGRFFESHKMPDENDPFPMPEKVKNCPHCGKALNPTPPNP